MVNVITSSIASEKLNAFKELAGHCSWNKTERNSGQNCSEGGGIYIGVILPFMCLMNQTKWWFAKRFMHPYIVTEYKHIFLWDEELGVENFDPERYLSIIQDEGLEMSQPALDPVKSEMYHPITARVKKSKDLNDGFQYIAC
uniref:uncharacterized protein LOC101305953 n=1 Tax=Fragaria vesca subsp. vesca TaxID=101020 RepID=UPI0005CAE0EE|nr:PREDICTED: uncharacterized protein LOC101305953 [Fragaria vesca subsp. vesca]